VFTVGTKTPVNLYRVQDIRLFTIHSGVTSNYHCRGKD